LLYILYGADDFSLGEALQELKGELGVADIAFFEGQKLSLDELITTCDTMPFLAAKRLVIVEGLLSRFERKGKQPPELAQWRGLREYSAAMPPSTELVLVDGKLRKDNPLLKELAPRSKVRAFPPLRRAELYSWIRSRVRKVGGNISPAALRLLADLIGENLWVLSIEIDKLCLYARGRRIEEEDVRLLVSYAREANIFALVDAIVQKRMAVASQLLHQLRAEGAAAPYLLFMLTRQFRLLIRAKELGSQASSTELAAKLGLPDYLLPRVLGQAQGYSTEELKGLYHRLLDVDVLIKTGRMKDELALDLLVIELCQAS
jgi:DNA polymerase-3 subunit delta